MKPKLHYITIILLAISALLLIISEVGLNNIPYVQPITAKKSTIEKIVEKKVQSAFELSTKILENIDSSCNSSSFEKTLNFINSLPEKDRFEIFIYRNNSLLLLKSTNQSFCMAETPSMP